MPVVESHPVHPPSADVASGVAVSVTDEPAVKLPAHVEPHEMPPGELVTVPSPAPAFVTARFEPVLEGSGISEENLESLTTAPKESLADEA